MNTIIGTSNKVLEINLSERKVSEFIVADQDRRMYLGGKGLGMKFLYERLKPGVDPLGEENVLCFMMGVVMGTGAPCTGRFAALTKSPLTGIILTSSCGGPFGMAYKTAGYDGLIVTGRSETPVCLKIDDSQIDFEDASHLWGKDTKETQDALNMGKHDGALVIGPAGENQVLFANIATGHRFLGRGGMGAVMGAKNLKAIVACGGAYKIVPANRYAFRSVKKRALKYINSNPFTSHAYRKYGTSVNVLHANRDGYLPVRNFRGGSHADANQVSGETMQEKYKSKPSSCKQCAILCGHKGTYPDGVHQIPEYETVGLLGTNIDVFDTEQITEWNDICGGMGMDTISSGASLAWLMEAGEKGLIRTDLKFGSPDGVSEMLKDMAYRRGMGDDLAQGTRRLSEKYGGKEFAIQIKGLEVAAYDPRGIWGQGLSYAVANRGGCHLSAYVVGLESLLGLLNPYTTRAKPEFVKFFEELTCCINSLHTCQFTMFAYTLEPPLSKYTPKKVLGFLMQYIPALAVKLIDFSTYTSLWSATTGIQMSNSKFLRAGERIHVLERYMNTREGISRKDDTLPERFLKEARECDRKKRTVPLEKMLNDYYELRGYDANGIPTAETLGKLGLMLDV